MLTLPENKSLNILPESNGDLPLRAMVARLKHRLFQRQQEVLSLRQQLKALDDSNRSYAAAEKSGWSRDAYLALVYRLRSFVEQITPEAVNIVVASRGDPELLKFGGNRCGWHFPQNKEGVYSGHNLADSSAMIAHLEDLRGCGAHSFVLPATSFWWFLFYSEFRNHLFTHYRKIADDSETCSIFDLRHAPHAEPPPGPSPAPVHPPSPPPANSPKIQEFFVQLQQIRELLDLVVPDDASIAVISRGNPDFLELGSRKTMHFPIDDSGAYLGHPADSAEAVNYLDQARALGAQYLLVPNSALWWLDYYKDFAACLQNQCRPVLNQPHICSLFYIS